MVGKNARKFPIKWSLAAIAAAAAALVLCLGWVCLSQSSAAAVSGDTIEDLSVMTNTEIALIASSKDASSDSIAQTGTVSSTAYISQAEALALAYANAGVNSADILKSKTEFDSRKGVMIYEVEFETASKKGEYEIDAATGEILDYEVKPNSSGSSAAGASCIGDWAAQQTALTHAGIPVSEVLKMETELDEDNGILIYKVEFETSTQKGEYRIAASTGEVLRFQVETKGSSAGSSSTPASASADPSTSASDSASTGTAGYIGGEAAEAAALAHAGVSAGSTVYLKWYYQYRSGKPVNYCVEFGAGSTKYVYTVDLYSGDVVHCDTYPFHSHS